MVKHFYFWQNMVSMHQSAFIRALGNVEGVTVTLIVEEYLYEERKKMGWSIPDHGNVEIRCFEEAEPLDWKGIVDKSDKQASYHIFSGVGAYRKNHQAFKHAAAHGYKIAIMAEPLDDRGWKGAIRLAISRLNRIRYGRYMRFWLTIGEKAYWQYNKVGYPEKKLFNWEYCVEPISYITDSDSPQDTYRIIYAGSLYPWKGYDLLIEALKELSEFNFTADFYSVKAGNEALATDLKERSALGQKLEFKPMTENTELRNRMTQYDLLVLPSRYDGWGTVINEALMAGTPVIVTNNCGAATLVKYHAEAGQICRANDKADLVARLKERLKMGKWSAEKRQGLKTWADKHITGDALVPYFLEIVKAVELQQAKPLEPWRAEY